MADVYPALYIVTPSILLEVRTYLLAYLRSTAPLYSTYVL